MPLKIVLVAALVAATSVSAQPRDLFEGPWAGDCGRDVYCELQVRLADGAYRVDFLVEERGTQVCRIDGRFARTDAGRLSGGFGNSPAVDIVRHETGTGLFLALSGVLEAPCGLPLSVPLTFRWFVDE